MDRFPCSLESSIAELFIKNESHKFSVIIVSKIMDWKSIRLLISVLYYPSLLIEVPILLNQLQVRKFGRVKER